MSEKDAQRLAYALLSLAADKEMEVEVEDD